jgi:hypothetical protein
MFGKDGGDHESDAKMKVLEELREMAMGMMGEGVEKKLSPMSDETQQVTVASDSEEGL